MQHPAAVNNPWQRKARDKNAPHVNSFFIIIIYFYLVFRNILFYNATFYYYYYYFFFFAAAAIRNYPQDGDTDHFGSII